MTVGDLREALAKLDSKLMAEVALNGSIVPVTEVTALEGTDFVVIRGKGKPPSKTLTIQEQADGLHVKYSLESKYAEYYLDKVKDLPVFLVVADVNKKKAWWLFLQPVLDQDHSWRNQKSITVALPLGNDFTDKAHFRKAVEEAKQWMRLNHPTSIHDAVIAQKQRITRIDERFTPHATLVGDQPVFMLIPKEDVTVSMTFSKKSKETEKKMIDLLDNGATVDFEPGEVSISGSGLFEPFEAAGGAMKIALKVPVAVTLVCRDAEGNERGRISDMPGQLTGGRKKQWCEANFPATPLAIKIGPFSTETPGSVKVNVSVDLKQWSGQRLLTLSYFDRLADFFKASASSTSIAIECHHNGNMLLPPQTLPLQGQDLFPFVAGILDLLRKARMVAQKMSVHPLWSARVFNENMVESIEELYGILFNGGWYSNKPDEQITWKSDEPPGPIEANVNGKRCPVWIVTNLVYSLLGEKVIVSNLLRHYSDMKLICKKRRKSAQRRTGRPAKHPLKSSKIVYQCMLAGSKLTKMYCRLATPQDNLGQPSFSMGRIRLGPPPSLKTRRR